MVEVTFWNYMYLINPLPNNNILDLTKLKHLQATHSKLLKKIEILQFQFLSELKTV